MHPHQHFVLCRDRHVDLTQLRRARRTTHDGLHRTFAIGEMPKSGSFPAMRFATVFMIDLKSSVAESLHTAALVTLLLDARDGLCEQAFHIRRCVVGSLL